MSEHDSRPGTGDHALQAYLAARGLPPEARQRGFHGLVLAWEKIARAAARYDLTLDDWRNDLDLRDLIAGALTVASEHDVLATRDALARADALFRAGTQETRRPVWTSAEHPADPAAVHSTETGATASEWWYRRGPLHPGDSMRAELEAAGLLAST